MLSIIMTLVPGTHEICSSSWCIVLRVTDREYSFQMGLMLQSNNCNDCLVPRIQILVLSDVLLCISLARSLAIHWQGWPVCEPLCLHLKVLNIVIEENFEVEHTIEPSDLLTLSIWHTCWTVQLYKALPVLHIGYSTAQHNDKSLSEAEWNMIRFTRPKYMSKLHCMKCGGVKSQYCMLTTG